MSASDWADVIVAVGVALLVMFVVWLALVIWLMAVLP